MEFANHEVAWRDACWDIFFTLSDTISANSDVDRGKLYRVVTNLHKTCANLLETTNAEDTQRLIPDFQRFDLVVGRSESVQNVEDAAKEAGKHIRCVMYRTTLAVGERRRVDMAREVHGRCMVTGTLPPELYNMIIDFLTDAMTTDVIALKSFRHLEDICIHLTGPSLAACPEVRHAVEAAFRRKAFFDLGLTTYAAYGRCSLNVDGRVAPAGSCMRVITKFASTVSMPVQDAGRDELLYPDEIYSAKIKINDLKTYMPSLTHARLTIDYCNTSYDGIDLLHPIGTNRNHLQSWLNVLLGLTSRFSQLKDCRKEIRVVRIPETHELLRDIRTEYMDRKPRWVLERAALGRGEWFDVPDYPNELLAELDTQGWLFW